MAGCLFFVGPIRDHLQRLLVLGNMSKLYHNPPRKDSDATPLVGSRLAPRILPPRKHRDPIAYGRLSGKDLRAIRQYHRLSQRQLASILLVDHSTVTHWENGRSGIPYEMHPAIALLDAPKDRLGNPTIATGLAIVDLKTHEVIRLF